MSPPYPRKRFGQHFLRNPHIIDQILQAMRITTTDKMLEIGPGLGALTQPLLKLLLKLIVIEIDKDLLPTLRQLPNATKLQIMLADALTVDYSQWGDHLRLIGNLPYNISTPLLVYLLNFTQWIQDMHFMLQKEVALRLIAQPGSKAYGRLSILIQYFCAVEHLFDISPCAFYPQPKVQSTLLRFIPYQTPIYPQVNILKFKQLLAQAFSMRRKTIANNLKTLVSMAELIKLGILPQARPEQLTIDEYIKITNYLGASARSLSKL